jgi:hypothetical protein
MALLAFWTCQEMAIPMVDNSVKFALERCKQFLELAKFFQPKALTKNFDIRRTKRVMLTHTSIIFMTLTI